MKSGFNYYWGYNDEMLNAFWIVRMKELTCIFQHIK